MGKIEKVYNLKIIIILLVVMICASSFFKTRIVRLPVGLEGTNKRRIHAHVISSHKVCLRPTSIFKLNEKDYYFFRQGMTDGNASLISALGAKGANLAEMGKMGLPVPPGFTISTRITNQILTTGESTEDFKKDIKRYIRRIERRVGYKFGDKEKPLLLSCRGGSKYSMPGFLGTVTNIGLNNETVEGLSRLSGNRDFAYKTYIRFILDYGEEVLNIEKNILENVIETELHRIGVATVDTASIDTLRTLIQILKEEITHIANKSIPDDPFEQLMNSIMTVIESWNEPEAVKYRERNSVPHDIGTAVNVQAMVFGNLNENSATGVAFTRNPLNGEKEVFGEVLFNVQGKDIVSGRVTPLTLGELDNKMPEVATELRKYLELLETRFKEIQDVEFTIQDGKLWILQTRGNERKVTPLARVRILMDLAEEGEISEEEALERVDLDNFLWFKKYLEAPVFTPKSQREVLATGIPASPGIAEGGVCLDREKAITLSKQGKPVILVLNQSFVQDEEAIKTVNGTLTRLGGATCHAAIIARSSKEMKPVITGVNEILFEEDGFTIGNTKVKEGDFIILDGNSGNIFKGRIEEVELKTSDPTASPYYERLGNWIEIKQKKEADAVFVREIELKTDGVDRIKLVVEDTLEKAREVLHEHPITWREEMQNVTFSLLWIAEDEADRKLGRLTYEETVFSLKYIYREDENILARLIHCQGLTHQKVLDIFNEYIDLERDDFGIKLFNLIGRFNIGDLTGEEYNDFLLNSVFPIIRILVGLESLGNAEKYIAGSTNETIASIIEEGVRFISVYRENVFAQLADRISHWHLDDAEGICRSIARRVYDDSEMRSFLLGEEDSHGRLSQKAAEWFNGFMDEVRKERLEAERQQRLREIPVSLAEDIAIPRNEYPKEIWDAVEGFTHEYYAYYGDAEGEIDYQVSKIIDFGYNFYDDDPKIIEHMRQCLEYSFVDDDDYYLKPALNLVFFSYFAGVADTTAIQKVFHAASPKIVIAFLNYAAEVDIREPELAAQFLINSEIQKKEFFTDILTGQSNERIARIKNSLSSGALSIWYSLEKTLPNLSQTITPLKKTQEAIQTGN